MTTLTKIRVWLILFIIGLVISGITAFPLELETRLALDLLPGWAPSGLTAWFERVHDGLAQTYAAYPFIAYATDWLAFAHLVIAVAFWGPLRDPVRNIWVVWFGVIACIGVIPLALIAGPIRGIPWGWRLIDMSFGVVGIVPLLIVARLIRRLAAQPTTPTPATAP